MVMLKGHVSIIQVGGDESGEVRVGSKFASIYFHFSTPI